MRYKFESSYFASIQIVVFVRAQVRINRTVLKLTLLENSVSFLEGSALVSASFRCIEEHLCGTCRISAG